MLDIDALVIFSFLTFLSHAGLLVGFIEVFSSEVSGRHGGVVVSRFVDCCVLCSRSDGVD